jgi:hypothetical protein
MSASLWRSFVRVSSVHIGRLSPIPVASSTVRFCSGTGGGGKIPRPANLGMRAKKEDATKGKGPVSWVNLGVTGVVVLSMVIIFLYKIVTSLLKTIQVRCFCPEIFYSTVFKCESFKSFKVLI